MKVDAIVIAGGEINGNLQNESGVTNEALIPIGNTIMVDYVVSALEKAPSVDKIVVVGPTKDLKKYYEETNTIILVEPGATAVESVLNGLKYISMNKKLLICTGDIPLLTPEAVEDFLSTCSSKEADLHYSIVPQEVNEKKYPDVKRTYVKLKEGTFTGGNILLVNPGIIHRCAEKGEELVRLRKSPLALSRLIGFRFILKFLLHLLSLSDTEDKFSKLLGIKGVGIISNYPEVGIDVDKQSDLILVKKVLEEKVS